jgi:hypothetical protein
MKFLFSIFIFKDKNENYLGQLKKIFCYGNSGGYIVFCLTIFPDFDKNVNLFLISIVKRGNSGLEG